MPHIANRYFLTAKMKSTDNLFRTLTGNPKFTKIGRGLWALTEWVEMNPDLFASNGATR